MQNTRYHIITTLSVVFFSFVLAYVLSALFRHSFSPSSIGSRLAFTNTITQNPTKRIIDINAITGSGMFKLPADGASDNAGADVQAQTADNLVLLGTITGPASIARALINKRGESETKAYPLWSDVFGNKLVRIDNSKVYLKSGETVSILDMFADKSNSPDSSQPSAGNAGADRIKMSLSKSEIQQKSKNNLDTILRGLRAGPALVNGKFDGFKLFVVPQENFLYTIGARSGDIIKRINGQQIDSTEKMYRLWANLTNESKVVLDIEREGRIVSFDYTFTD